MPADEKSIHLYSSTFRGLNLKTGKAEKGFNSAEVCENFVRTNYGKGTIRKGRQAMFRLETSSSLHRILYPETYRYFDTDGVEQEELIALEIAHNSTWSNRTNTLKKISPSTLTITYVGAGTGSISITPVPALGGGSWRATLVANGVTVLNKLYNTVYASDPTVLNLATFVSDVHALAGFNCSPTSIPSGAQYCPLDVIAPLSVPTMSPAGSVSLEYYNISTITGDGDNVYPVGQMFTSEDFVIPSFFNHANNIYIAYGSYLHKYDGLAFYRAGVIQGTVSGTRDSASGSTFAAGETYIYKTVISRVDNRGNIIEGEDSDDTLPDATHTMTGTKDLEIDVGCFRASSYPNFNLKGARVNGAQVAVSTITVDAGHTLTAGDTAYLYDSITSSYITSVVSSVGATTITISTSVTVADNAVISNNVRIQIWRTTNGGTDFFLVEEIPNDPFFSTFTYTDSTPDDDLGEPFVEQLRKHSLPPFCTHVGGHQGLMLVSGDFENPRRTSWNLPDDIEAFPIESNNTDIKTIGGRVTTGFGTLDDETLAIFTDSSYVLIKGTLDDLNFRSIDKARAGIGCTSFRTLAYIGENNALVGLSSQGPFIFSGDNASLSLGDPLSPLFENVSGVRTDNVQIYDDDTPVLKRAIGFNDINDRKYHLILPVETGTPAAQKYVQGEKALWLVFDYDGEIPYWTTFVLYYGDSTILTSGTLAAPDAGFCSYRGVLWHASAGFNTGTVRTGIVYRQRGVLANSVTYTQGLSFNAGIDYLDADIPVALDIYFTPITREEGAVSSFLKSLRVLYHNFTTRNILRDEDLGPGGSNTFFYNIKTILNHAISSSPSYATAATRTFTPATDTTQNIKAVGSKARAVQIVLNNKVSASADLDDHLYEVPRFDEIEFIYSTPYDKKAKEPAK